jgi:hypothetical protein
MFKYDKYYNNLYYKVIPISLILLFLLVIINFINLTHLINYKLKIKQNIMIDNFILYQEDTITDFSRFWTNLHS